MGAKVVTGSVLATLRPLAEQVLQTHLQVQALAQPAGDESAQSAGLDGGCPRAALPAWQLCPIALPLVCCTPAQVRCPQPADVEVQCQA